MAFAGWVNQFQQDAIEYCPSRSRSDPALLAHTHRYVIEENREFTSTGNHVQTGSSGSLRANP